MSNHRYTNGVNGKMHEVSLSRTFQLRNEAFTDRIAVKTPSSFALSRYSIVTLPSAVGI